MVKRNEVERKPHEAFWIYFGCHPIIPSEDLIQSASMGKELQEQLHKIFISQDFVASVHKSSEPKSVNKRTIAEGIVAESTIRKGVDIYWIDSPIKIELKYSSDKLDPDFYNLHKTKIDIEATLFYDGFLYIIAMKLGQGKFNYRRHMHHLDKWILTTLTSGKDWNILDATSSPYVGTIKAFFLKEAPESTKSETGYPIYCEDSPTQNPHLAYVRGKDESLTEALNYTLQYMSLGLEPKLYNYYLLQIVHSEIRKENTRAREIIGRVVNRTMNYYDINLFKLLKRFKSSREIGKDLVHLYAIMPQIEKLENEFETFRKELASETVFFDDINEAITKMINNDLPERTENVFSSTVREMLQQDVSEIRAQINYQILLVSAIVTFLAVIITAIVAIIS